MYVCVYIYYHIYKDVTLSNFYLQIQASVKKKAHSLLLLLLLFFTIDSIHYY